MGLETETFDLKHSVDFDEASTAGNQWYMTATPIPRTLAMSAYADLDTSILDELPPGRTPVNTVLVTDTRRAPSTWCSPA